MDWGKVGEYIIGSIPSVGAVIVYLFRIDRKLGVFLVEHEILMGDYAKRNNIKLHELPTRSRWPRH